MRLTTSPPWTVAPAALVWGLFWVHLLAQPVYALLPQSLELPGTFVIVLSFAAFSFAHCWLERGGRAALALLALCVVVCGGLEKLSLETGFPFGRYTYGPALGPSVVGAPLIMPLCWLMMAYPASRLAELVAGRFYVPIAALALTAWDLFHDPQNVARGFWTWAEPGPYAGIPWSNYAGWLFTSLLLFALYRPFARLAPRPERPDTFGALPLVAYAWTWFGSTLVNAVWWGQPLVALVGGLGMGPFALAGLWAAFGFPRPARAGQRA